MSRPSQHAAPTPPRGKLERSSRNILIIFIATAVILGGIAYYVTFFTDIRENAVNAVATETAAVYETAATNSTATAAAMLTAAAGTGTAVPATVESGCVVTSGPTAPAEETGP